MSGKGTGSYRYRAVKMRKDVYNLLKEVAKREGKSMMGLIREMIIERAKQHGLIQSDTRDCITEHKLIRVDGGENG